MKYVKMTLLDFLDTKIQLSESANETIIFTNLQLQEV